MSTWCGRAHTSGFDRIPSRIQFSSLTACAPVAQLDRASASGAEGHRFESCRARRIDRPAVRVFAAGRCRCGADWAFSQAALPGPPLAQFGIP